MTATFVGADRPAAPQPCGEESPDSTGHRTLGNRGMLEGDRQQTASATENDRHRAFQEVLG